MGFCISPRGLALAQVSVSNFYLLLRLICYLVASVIFLYGNVGRSHGLVEVAWGDDNATVLDAVPRFTFTGESDAELSDALLFTGYAPEGGWANFYLTNTDDRYARKLEFTRLEVYAVDPQHQPTRYFYVSTGM